MSKPLPSREQAIQLLNDLKTPFQVVNHCSAVAKFALNLSKSLKQKGLTVDIELVEVGALLHDIGRSQTHSVDHGVLGGQLASSFGWPEPVVKIIKRHVGAGITEEEASKFGWPKDIYIPQSLEEKIVCYADKRTERGKVVPIENEINRLHKGNKPEAAERVRRLHQEIAGLLEREP